MLQRRHSVQKEREARERGAARGGARRVADPGRADAARGPPPLSY
jgi:hypothetical protein